MAQEFAEFFLRVADGVGVLALQRALELHHGAADGLALFAEVFFIQAFAFFQQVDVFLLLARVDFERGEAFECGLHFFFAQVDAVVAEGLVDFDVEVFVAHVHVQQAVGVVAEAHVDVHFAGAARGHAHFELAELEVFAGEHGFALQHAKRDGGLPVVHGGIAGHARYGHGHITLDNRAENAVCDAAVRQLFGHFHAQREGHHVGEHYFFHVAVARQQGGLHRCAARDGFIGIDRGFGNAAEQLGDGVADNRHPRGAAHQNDAVDLARVQLGVAQGAFQRLAQPRHQRFGGFLEFLAGNRGGGHAVAYVHLHFGLHFFAEPAFGGFQSLPQLAAVGEAGAFFVAQFFAFGQKKLAQHLHEIFAAQVVVARAGGYLHHAVEIIQHGYVERAAAEVVNQKAGVVGLFLQAVGQAGGGGLVEQAQRVEPGHLRGVARGLALDGVEIGGHGNHHVAHFFAQIGFGIFFQLAQHQCGELFGAELLAVEPEDFVGAHEAFEGGGGGLRGGAQPLACGQPHQYRAVIRHAYHGRRERVAEPVGNQAGFAVDELGDEAVGGA